jgi:hypothetical protein
MKIAELTRTWTKTTTTGKLVVVTITMDDMAYRAATSVLDGKTYRASSVYCLKLSKPLVVAGCTVVASLDLIGLGKVGMTANEYASFEAVLADQDAAMRANPTLPILVKSRKDLTAELSDAIRAASDGASRRFDRYDDAYCSTAKEDARITKAQADLAAFDASHPNVLAEIERESAASVARFLACD